MKLSDYLQRPGQTATAIAAMVGCSASSISRAARGKVIPSRDQMRKIFEATNGAVTPNDFFGVEAAVCPGCIEQAAGAQP